VGSSNIRLTREERRNKEGENVFGLRRSDSVIVEDEV
jgi:hypothetical protein